MSAPVLVAEVVRDGFVEGQHYGSVVVTDPDGDVLWGLGVVDQPMLPRSANKPMQTLGMLRSGLSLDGELLALATASHSGETMHLDGVRRILAGVGLTEQALRTTPGYPLDDRARDEWARAGRGPEPLSMNCSGKHAAMLATCVEAGWPTETHLDPDNPVQQAIRAALEDVAAEEVDTVTVDGCGAPLLSLRLTGLARAFGRIAASAEGTLERRVADAVRDYPEWVSGTRRDEAALMRAVPGLMGKGGAEGVYAAGLPDGRGVAVKIADGAARARAVVMAETLHRLGIECPEVDRQRRFPVLGGGRPIGAVHARLAG